MDRHNFKTKKSKGFQETEEEMANKKQSHTEVGAGTIECLWKGNREYAMKCNI